MHIPDTDQSDDESSAHASSSDSRSLLVASCNDLESDGSAATWCTEKSEDFQNDWQELREAREASDQRMESDLDSDLDLGALSDAKSVDRKFQEPPSQVYAPSKMFTNVQVLAHQKFGPILSRTEKVQMHWNSDNKDMKVTSIIAGGPKAVVAIAIVMGFDLINVGKIPIRDAKDTHMMEYDIVDEWQDIPKDLLMRTMGWAR